MYIFSVKSLYTIVRQDTKCYWPSVMVKIFGTNQRNHAEWDSTRRIWYLLLRDFWPLFPIFCFWKCDCAPDRPIFEIFLKFKNFVRSSFGNAWDDSYIKFLLWDIKFKFTLSSRMFYLCLQFFTLFVHRVESPSVSFLQPF